MGGTDWPGLPPQVSQPITRGFMAFLVWEHGWMLWGTLVLEWRSEGRGCKAITH